MNGFPKIQAIKTKFEQPIFQNPPRFDVIEKQGRLQVVGNYYIITLWGLEPSAVSKATWLGCSFCI